MQIGACGIACEVCSAFTGGSCQGCVSGTSELVSEVLDSQQQKFGFTCPVLRCASSRSVSYCLKDCADFPCNLLYRGFPYSAAFLDLFKKA